MWEAIFRVAVNAESQAVVELPDVFQEPDLLGEEPASAPDDPTTYATAIAEGKRRLIAASAEFVRRIEQRLERDRKRLQDYYRALSREAGRLETSRGGGFITRGNRGQEAGGGSGVASQAGGIERKLRPAGRIAAGGLWRGFVFRRSSFPS